MEKDELNRLQDLASVGNLSAINKLVEYYLTNNDYQNAFLTAQRYEFFSDAQGYKTLGYFYQKGVGTPADLEKAAIYYKKSFKLGDIASGYNVALINVKNKNFQDALIYLTNGIENNHVPSIRLLANLYLNGDGLVEDRNVAISLLEKAVELGDSKSITQLAKIYYVDKEYAKAFELFKKGADFGDIDSIYHVGLCYAKGLGTRQDFALAFKYYEIGAKQLEPRCLYNLSLYYRGGISVPRNEELANKLEEQAVQHGFKK